MSISTTSSGTKYDGAFWEWLWRSAGIQSALFFVVAFAIYGHQPQAGASADALAAFYVGERTRVLVAAIVFGMATLNLLWFASAVRTALGEAGRDGWGGAVTAAGAAFGSLFLLFVTVVVVLAYSIAGTGNAVVTSALNDFAWALVVLSSFPRAMLIMAGSFGLWRASLISNAVFAICVGAVVLVLLGGTTWMNGGVWSPDGLYARLISPAIGLVWVTLVSVFLTRRPAPGTGW